MRGQLVSIRMMLGFFAGFIAVLIFQQVVVALSYGLHFSSSAPYSADLTLPLGVPYVWALAFWGGVFGVILGGIDRHFPAGPRLWRSAALFGAVAPTALQWILTLALPHRPLGGTWTIGNIVTPFVANALWGIGTEMILSGLSVAWRIDVPD